MKKSKLLRKIAYPAAPQHADGFVPPAGHTFKMSVNLRDTSIKVYGFDGSSWTMIHNTDGVISDFITDVTYQKYYFESKTTLPQTVRVSFLSSENKEDIHDFEFGATSNTRKLHHFDDVPIYRGVDVGKFLTIMSDGTLRWLTEGDSYIVESEGGEGGEEGQGGNGGGGGQVIPGTFLEELSTAANNIFRPAYNSITNGIFTQSSAVATQKGATKVDLDVEGIMSYSGNTLDPKEWTLSFWVAAEVNINGGYNYCGGRFESNEELRLAMGKTGDGYLRFQPIIGNLWTGTPKAKSTIPFATGQFHHCAVTYSLSPGYTDKYDLKIFIDGVKGGEALQKSFHVLNKSNGNIWFGLGMAAYGAAFNGTGGAFSLDSVQLSQGALTEAQVAAIAAQSDRQMSIETAALQ